MKPLLLYRELPPTCFSILAPFFALYCYFSPLSTIVSYPFLEGTIGLSTIGLRGVFPLEENPYFPYTVVKPFYILKSFVTFVINRTTLHYYIPCSCTICRSFSLKYLSQYRPVFMGVTSLIYYNCHLLQ